MFWSPLPVLHVPLTETLLAHADGGIRQHCCTEDAETRVGAARELGRGKQQARGAQVEQPFRPDAQPTRLSRQSRRSISHELPLDGFDAAVGLSARVTAASGVLAGA
jgi:hypothetical protein